MIASRHFRTILFLFLVAIGRTEAQSSYDEIEEETKGALKKARKRFNDLPPAAKFGTAAAAGFVTSRVALKSFVSAAKVAGAAFIASEVLAVSGVLEDTVLEDHAKTVADYKDRLLEQANRARKGVRDTLTKDKMAGMGFATGAFIAMAA